MGLPSREETYIEKLSEAETFSGTATLPAPPPTPTLMPINPTERNWRTRHGFGMIPGHTMDRARDVLYTTKESAGRMYREARRRAEDGYARLSQRSRELGNETLHVARYAQQKYPVRVLGIIAVSAFVVGIGLRAWRSR